MTGVQTCALPIFNFSQPIQLRFNELMTGAKADIAIKLYGEDMAELYKKAKEASLFVEQVPGAADVIVEQAMGLPQLVVHYDRAKIARYGICLFVFIADRLCCTTIIIPP